jgi:type IV secretory pathway TrbF-like protein
MNMTIPEIEAGTYDISLDYQVMSSSSSIMPYVVVTDQDGNQIVAKSLDNSGTSLQLDNVNITSDMTQFTVKCINTDGVVLKLKSIQFEKQ